MANLTVRVAPGLTGWAASDHDVDLEAGVDHELKRPSKALTEQVAAAVAAGSLELVAGALPKGAVEDDKASLKVRDKAEAARAPLYEERDRKIAESDAKAGEKILDEYEEKMAEAAQKAVEG